MMGRLIWLNTIKNRKKIYTNFKLYDKIFLAQFWHNWFNKEPHKPKYINKEQ